MDFSQFPGAGGDVELPEPIQRVVKLRAAAKNPDGTLIHHGRVIGNQRRTVSRRDVAPDARMELMDPKLVGDLVERSVGDVATKDVERPLMGRESVAIPGERRRDRGGHREGVRIDVILDQLVQCSVLVIQPTKDKHTIQVAS